MKAVFNYDEGSCIFMKTMFNYDGGICIFMKAGEVAFS